MKVIYVLYNRTKQTLFLPFVQETQHSVWHIPPSNVRLQEVQFDVSLLSIQAVHVSIQVSQAEVEVLTH
jgi:hypothetical protein